MAVFRMFVPASNPGATCNITEFVEIAFGPALTNLSGTKLRLHDTVENIGSVMSGSGFQVNLTGPEPHITGGTINQITATFQGSKILSVTGLNLSAKAIFDAVSAEENAIFYNLLLGGNDQIFGTANADNITGLGGNDRLVGNGNADTIFGDTGNDSLFGGNGHDAMLGEAGADRLFGGAGQDTLAGGVGADQLTGGTGADWFLFLAPVNASDVDRVMDFQHGIDDIVLQAGDFTAAGPVGTLAGNRFFKGTAAHDADDRIIYNPTTGALIYDVNGDAAGGAKRIAILDTGLNLTASDFEIGGFA